MTAPKLSPSRDQRGFTLVELMVTLAIFGLLAMLAMPGLTPLLVQWQRDSVTRNMTTHFQQARSEAIKTSRRVVVCPLDPDQPTEKCLADNQWKDGWLVFIDGNGNNRYDPSQAVTPENPDPSGDRLLSLQDSSAGISSIKSWATTTGNDGTVSVTTTKVQFLTFLPSGLLAAGRSRITITPSNSAVKDNELDINQVGRVSVTSKS